MAVIISKALSLSSAIPDQPMTHARIGYRSIWRAPGAIVSASSESAKEPAQAAASENTYERWRPTSLPATWSVETDPAIAVNYAGIAAHDLGSQGCTVQVQYYDGTDWQTIIEHQPGDDTPIMLLFERTRRKEWRVRVTGDNAPPSLGVIFIGETLDMQRPIYGGHSPITMSRQTQVTPSKSDGGQFLGRSVFRRGVSTDFSWDNLTADWVRNYLDHFIRYATQGPGGFFIAWRPKTYPREVGYVWTNDDIQPSNSGTRNLMSVRMSVNGQIDLPYETQTERYA